MAGKAGIRMVAQARVRIKHIVKLNLNCILLLGKWIVLLSCLLYRFRSSRRAESNYLANWPKTVAQEVCVWDTLVSVTPEWIQIIKWSQNPMKVRGQECMSWDSNPKLQNASQKIHHCKRLLVSNYFNRNSCTYSPSWTRWHYQFQAGATTCHRAGINESGPWRVASPNSYCY